jgi:glutamate synthase domain-containing protein 3
MILLYETGSCCGNVLEVKTTVCGIINIFALIKCVRIVINFIRISGQSFGAFICRGITLELEGDANDYLGKVY